MERYIYVGTYTQDILFGTGEVLHGKGEGIYRLRQDVATGRLSPDTVWREIENPSFLTLNPKRDRLYAVNELKRYNGAFSGSVSAFAICGDRLEPLGRLATGGTDPCHVALRKDGQTLYVANFMSGSVAVFRLDENGALAERLQVIQHEGHSVDAQRQQGPHAHCVALRGEYAFVPDLGLDRVLCYGVEADGVLTARPERDYAARPGSGPRQLAFSKDGETAFVMNELDSTVTMVRWSDRGAPSIMACLSTLPPGGSQTPASGACIRLNEAGTYLYASNRGHNSIAVFQVGDDLFKQVGCYDCCGAIPRDFTITPDDRFLICANQTSDALTVFALDERKGGLRLVQTYPVPTPVCVVAE